MQPALEQVLAIEGGIEDAQNRHPLGGDYRRRIRRGHELDATLACTGARRAGPAACF
jgi:hypothetical protein